MTVFELHLQVNQRLQEVASYKKDKYYPEEIDMALNKAMFRLLEEGVDNKFQGDQVNLSHVVALINKNKAQEVIIPEDDDPIKEPDVESVYTPTPSDLYWLINLRSEVVKDLENCTTAPDIEQNSISEYVTILPFPGATSTASPFYNSFTITSTLFSNFYLPPFPSIGSSTNQLAFLTPESKYVLINDVIDYFRTKTTRIGKSTTGTAVTTSNTSYPKIQVYWERYREVFYKDSFIFVSSSPIGNLTLSYNKADTTVEVSQTGTTTINTYTSYNRATIDDVDSAKKEVQSSKPLRQDVLYSGLRQNKYYNTRFIEPLFTQTQDYLIVYHDESFLVTRIYLDYIRKPRTISLALNQSCELADSTHPKIVDLAVEILRLDTKDQAYPATVQDTQLRNN